MEPRFPSLFHQIADSLSLGQVLFDLDLNILDMTSTAKRMLRPEARIDAAMAKGVEGTVQNEWKEMIDISLHANQKAVFRNISYWGNERKQLVDVTCVPLCEDGGDHAVGGVLVFSDTAGKMDSSHETAPSERLIAVGRVAGKVAHELNNPLDGILRYVNLSLRILEQGQPEKAVEYIQHCRTGLQRMAQIITEMLEFSKSSHFVAENSPIDKLLEDALRAMDGVLKMIHVRVVRQTAGPLPYYKSDALYQVFCNLIKNAADAMDGKGILTITVARVDMGFEIDFEDTGPGFSPYSAEELFRPFFTTKSPGRGTGLGLSICKDILEKFSGQISAENRPEGGACFRVMLPIHATASFRS